MLNGKDLSHSDLLLIELGIRVLLYLYQEVQYTLLKTCGE